jgi:signal transduction histidine kinase
VMDITWAERHLPAVAGESKHRLERARSALDAAIDLNRRMIEELRPTLLDTFGLIAALKWHFAHACKAANIICQQELPDPSPNFSPVAAISLYRAAETLIAVMVTHHARLIAMTVRVDTAYVTLEMNCDGPDNLTRDDDVTADALASVTGRVKSLGGTLWFKTKPAGAVITCRLPNDQVLKD